MQPLAVDGVHLRLAPERREREPEPAFGQAVHRQHRARVEAVRREARRKAGQRGRVHRLGAVERDAPRAQVQPLQLVVGHLGGQDLVGEVGRRRERAAVAVHRAQPACRAREKVLRRHQHERHAVVEAAHPGADQAHVVVQRQPADEHVGRPGADRRARHADVGQQVGVREHHALGLAGAARRVLQQRGVVRAARRGGRLAAAGRELIDRGDRAQRRHAGAQDARGRQHARVDDQQHSAGVVEDRRLAAQVVFDLRRAKRRIDRHRRAAGEQDAAECGEEVQPGRQHQRHAVAGCHTFALQPGGDRAGARRQFAVRERRDHCVVVAEQGDVAVPRRARGVPLQHLHERRRGARRFEAGRRRGRRCGRLVARNPARRRRGQRAHQVARRLRLLHQPFGHAHAEGLFQAQHQLHARQAVDAERALELVVERRRRRLAAAQLTQHRGQHREELRCSDRAQCLSGSPCRRFLKSVHANAGQTWEWARPWLRTSTETRVAASMSGASKTST